MTTMGVLTVCIDVDPLVGRLVHRAMTACDRAGLDDELAHVGRLIESGRLVEIESRDKARIRVRLTPYAELALRDVVEIGSDPRLDGATKARRIGEVFRLAGVTTGSCA